MRVKIDGRPQQLKLGVYPACTLKDAYDRALALRSEIKEGRDPRSEARRQKAGSNTPLTVADAVARFDKVEIFPLSQWAKEDVSELRELLERTIPESEKLIRTRVIEQ